MNYPPEIVDFRGACAAWKARAEAAESQVAALTASLASMTKERDREIDALQEEAEAHKFTTEMYATQCKQSWKESLRFESAEASLAELRKRMGEAEKALENQILGTKVALDNVDALRRYAAHTKECHDGIYLRQEKCVCGLAAIARTEGK